MLSKQLKSIIKLRLAAIKYTGCAVIHWDWGKDRVVLAKNYMFWVWSQLYYSGMGYSALLLYAIYISWNPEEDNLNNQQVNTQDGKGFIETFQMTLGITILLGYTVNIIFCLLIVSILRENRVAICAYYNACLSFEGTASEKFHEGPSSNLPRSIHKACRPYEFVTGMACAVSMTPALILLLSIYHPMDPLNLILREFLEIKVEPSPGIFVFSLVYAWSGFTLANTFITFLIPVLLTMTYCSVWTAAIMPTELIDPNTFSTAMMGSLQNDRIIWIYRSHQVLCNCFNAFMAQVRIASHFALLHILFIMSSFLLVKNFNLFLVNGSYELIGLLVVVMFLVAEVAGVECAFVGRVVENSRSLRNRILTKTARRLYVHKVVKSFQNLDIKTTYPFFTVNGETYFEFWEVGIDHIVNLLCLT